MSMRAQVLGLLLLLCGCIIAGARAIEPGQRAESWSLLSIDGMEIDFPRITEGRAALLLVLGPVCSNCAAMLAALQGLRDEFSSHQVEVYVVGAADARGLEAMVGAGHDFVLVPDGAEVGVQYGATAPATLVVLDQLGKASAVAQPLRDPDWAGAVRATLGRLVAPE
jgi:hypothetical protein